MWQIIDHRDAAGFVFHQCGAAFDPVPAVVIGTVAKFPNGGAVNVPAKHTINRKLFRVVDDFFLKPANKTDRVLDSLLGVGAQGPVTEAESSAEEIDERIERQQELVTDIAEKRQPLHILHDGIKLVPVDDENALSSRGDVDGAWPNVDVAVAAAEIADQFVVISRNINDAGPFTGLAQNFLDDVVVLLRPVTTPAHRPDIDQVSDHIERLEIVLA